MNQKNKPSKYFKRNMNYRTDCSLFKGDIPCKPSKELNCTCENCTAFEPRGKAILIIKLGALGDVIRTTPLIEGLQNKFGNIHITWLTLNPEILPDSVNLKLAFNFESILILNQMRFFIAINLDKDLTACSLMNQIYAMEKFGFEMRYNLPFPINTLAEHKFATGVFDVVSKNNTKNYLEEIFEICDLTFENERYSISLDSNFDQKWKEKFNTIEPNGKFVGLNTGCGSRWKTREWPEEYWEKLITSLQIKGLIPVLLGGNEEKEKNERLSKNTNAWFPGVYSVKEFFSIVNQCQLIVTPVTMTMHIALALNKKLILFNNIFNENEFYLYNQGVILKPKDECKCYYGNVCKEEKFCMNSLSPLVVMKNIENMLVELS